MECGTQGHTPDSPYCATHITTTNAGKLFSAPGAPALIDRESAQRSTGTALHGMRRREGSHDENPSQPNPGYLREGHQTPPGVRPGCQQRTAPTGTTRRRRTPTTTDRQPGDTPSGRPGRQRSLESPQPGDQATSSRCPRPWMVGQ